MRLWTSIKYEVMLLIVVSIALFGSYAGLRYASLPVIANTCEYLQNATASQAILLDASSTLTQSSCARTDETLSITVSFPIYVIALACWLGWWLLILFMGSGLTALPVDLINQFRFRPIPMKEDEFARCKAELAKQVDKLLQIGKQLLEDRMKSDKQSGFSGWKARRQIQTRQNEFESNCILIEREFTRLDQTAQYKHKVEPLVYVIKLLLGIICIVISLIIVIHLFCYILLKINNRPVHPFLNNLLESLEQSNVSVISTILFAFIGYYLMLCAMKGNVRVGMRLLCFTFYPLQQNETFVNSFVFNAIIMNLWMFALVQFMTDMFKEYIRQTSISMIFSVQIKNMYFFKYFLQYNVFNYILIAWICICTIYFILKPSERINLGMQVKKTDLAARA